MRRRGLTLFEVLLAVALIMALTGSMFGFFFDLLQTRERLLDRAMSARTAQTLIDRVERDVTACLVGGAGRGAGLRGDATTITVLTRGVPAVLAADPIAKAAFLADLERAEYRFDPATGRLEGRRVVGAGAGPMVPIGRAIARVRFRYFDGRRWRDAYDSEAEGRLPAAVEVAVWGGAAAGVSLDEKSPEPPDAIADASDIAGPFDPTDPGTPRDEGGPPPDRLRVIAVPDASGATP